MKKIFLFLCSVLISGILSTVPSFGQGFITLKVIDMPGFPSLPLDSAYEGQSYAFDIIVFNGTNNVINTTLEVLLKVDSLETVIASNPQPSIQPGDSLIISLTGYNFTQPQFKAGNNIVVVWPRVTNTPALPVDSFITNVVFIPLNATGSSPLSDFSAGFTLYPNPVSDQFLLSDFLDFSVEHVRIFSSSGRLVYEKYLPNQKTVNVGFLSPGIYFIELIGDGNIRRSKFVRQHPTP